jgi:hypothetical protein
MKKLIINSYACYTYSSLHPTLLGLLGFTPTTLGGSNSRMQDQAFKNSTTPASLSIFFSNPSADYKYSDTGSRAAGLISSEDVFKFFVKEL